MDGGMEGINLLEGECIPSMEDVDCREKKM